MYQAQALVSLLFSRKVEKEKLADVDSAPFAKV
jgi:hypothetical protein